MVFLGGNSLQNFLETSPLGRNPPDLGTFPEAFHRRVAISTLARRCGATAMHGGYVPGQMKRRHPYGETVSIVSGNQKKKATL